MSHEQIVVAYTVSNVVAVAMTLVALRWKTIGRLLFCALFLWAGQFNLRLGILHASEYLAYAEHAWAPYARFILGPFAAHTQPIVIVIAIAQLVAGVLIALRGDLVRLGLVSAIIFLMAIAPLGVGAAFPSTLVMAIGAALLIPAPWPHTLPVELWRSVRRGAPI